MYKLGTHFLHRKLGDREMTVKTHSLAVRGPLVTFLEALNCTIEWVAYQKLDKHLDGLRVSTPLWWRKHAMEYDFFPTGTGTPKVKSELLGPTVYHWASPASFWALLSPSLKWGIGQDEGPQICSVESRGCWDADPSVSPGPEKFLLHPCHIRYFLNILFE
jgi:hypothetical protein